MAETVNQQLADAFIERQLLAGRVESQDTSLVDLLTGTKEVYRGEPNEAQPNIAHGSRAKRNQT